MSKDHTEHEEEYESELKPTDQPTQPSVKNICSPIHNLKSACVKISLMTITMILWEEKVFQKHYWMRNNLSITSATNNKN
jgi:hypothetical protein